MLYDPGQLGQPEDPARGEVCDVGYSLEGEQVVLGQELEGPPQVGVGHRWLLSCGGRHPPLSGRGEEGSGG